MPEIGHKELTGLLKSGKKPEPVPVWLIHGEDLLVKNTLDSLLEVLTPGKIRKTAYEPIDNDNVRDALERVNTYALLSGPRVVALRDSRIFAGKDAAEKLAEKAREAQEKEDLKKAAGHLMALLGAKGLILDDFEDGDPGRLLGMSAETLGDGKWVERLLAYSREKGLAPAAVQDTAGLMKSAIEKGFPKANTLIITAEVIAKKSALYKTVKKTGTVVDCSAPKGVTWSDRKAQEAFLREQAETILAESGKRINPRAFAELSELTGFNLRTFAQNLEKLVSYAGERPVITAEDVNAVLTRSRRDPIFELTGAVADRKAEDALFYMKSLLKEGLFPLQILTAVANQVRRLIMARGFLDSPRGKTWKQGMQYKAFQSNVLPAVREYDADIRDSLSRWEGASAETGKKKGGRKASDLLMTQKGGSPYPIFLNIQKASKFTRRELWAALENVSEADRKLKSGGGSPTLILENLILNICLSQ